MNLEKKLNDFKTDVKERLEYHKRLWTRAEHLGNWDTVDKEYYLIKELEDILKDLEEVK